MSNFASLPEEIVSLIFQHLDRKHDQSCIRALRATSRRCHRLISPQLYVAVVAPGRANGLSTDIPGDILQQWAWKVAQHPELAYQIKEIHATKMNMDNHETRFDKPEKAHPREQWQAALQHSALPDTLQEQILDRLAQAASDGHMAFLLALCTYTEVLVTSRFSIGDLVTEVLMYGAPTAAAAAPVKSVQPSRRIADCIRRLEFPGAFAWEVGLAEPLRFLDLPHLQRLMLGTLSDSRDWWVHDIPPHEPGYHNFNAIDIESDLCMISGEGIGRLLSACAAPRSLALRWRPGLWNEHLRSMPIGDALRTYGLSLEYLLLDTTDVASFARVDPLQITFFGSFASLSCLRALAIPMPVFKDSVDDPASILPASLEKIYLLGVGKDMRSVDDVELWGESSEEDSSGDEGDEDDDSDGDDVHGSDEDGNEEESSSNPAVTPAEGGEEEEADAGNSEGNGAEPSSEATNTDQGSTDHAVDEGAPENNVPETTADTTPIDFASDEIVDRVVAALQNSPVRLPNLKRIIRVPWKFYSIYEHFGRVRQRCVHYDAVGGLPFRDLGGNE